jgi:hypothetical protein
MLTNIGKNDRLFRAVLGVAIIGAGIYFNSYWGLVGFVPLVTAYLRWCPLYMPLRISTKEK